VVDELTNAVNQRALAATPGKNTGVRTWWNTGCSRVDMRWLPSALSGGNVRAMAICEGPVAEALVGVTRVFAQQVIWWGDRHPRRW